MLKPIIAIDVDEVLADSAAQFIGFSNDQWGTNLTVDDYQEHWAETWQVDHAETARRSQQWDASGEVIRSNRKPGALTVLPYLAERFQLCVTTSRPTAVRADTIHWLEKHFPNTFDAVHFAGIFDDRTLEGDMYTMTKADLYQQIGAEYIIDDQLKHCVGAAEAGIQAILFGNYRWNQKDGLPAGITRAEDWAAVKAYFDRVG